MIIILFLKVIDILLILVFVLYDWEDWNWNFLILIRFISNLSEFIITTNE